MKKKIFLGENSSKSLKQLTLEANKIVEQLEKELDLKNSLDSYQKLIKLNNIIEKKFYTKSKKIGENIKEKIGNIKIRKNAKKRK
tara:strand:- start:2909 stop:3163 length:255 start_codon:yes stop_codon:yes gene_type:complete